MKSKFPSGETSSALIIILILLSLLSAVYNTESKYISLLIIPLAWLLMRFDQRASVIFIAAALYTSAILYGYFTNLDILMLSGGFSNAVLPVNLIFRKKAASGIHMDITERRQIEEKLKESEQMFRSIVENSYAGIYIIDDSFSFIYMNGRLCEMSGYSREELIGTDFRRLIDEESLKTVFDRYTEKFNGERLPSWYEITGIRRDGRKIFLESSSAVVKDSSGRLRTVGQMFDITERKKAEMSLKENEAMFRSLLEATPAGVGLLIDRKFLKINRALCTITGYSEEEMLGQCTRMLYPDDEEFERIGRDLYGQMRKDGLGVVEARIKRKDGAIIFVLLCLSPFNPDDLSKGVTTAVLDITDRKHAEDELRQIKVAIDATSDAIAMATAQGYHFYQNEAFNRMFGFTTEEVAKRHPIAAYKDKKIGQEVFETIMSGKSWHGEVDFVSKDERCFPVFLRADAVKDKSGNIVSVIGVHTDISERKKTEEQLLRSEEKYRNIFENAVEGIFQTTLDGHMISANPALAKIFGYDSPEQMINEVSSLVEQIYVHPEDRGKIMEILLNQNYAEGFEFEAYKKNKDMICISINARLIKDPDGKILYIEGTIFDITDRKKAERETKRLAEMLMHSQKIESIGRLAGGIAHDFNNLLTAILGNTELAMNMLDPDEKPYMRLTTVKKAAQGAAALTRQLLTFSRKQIIEPKVINLNVLIENISKVLITLIGENISLQIIPFKGLSAIKADPGHLEQIIINLAANARDAMPDGGNLILDTANVFLDEKYCENHNNVSPGEYVMLAISDTGCGMSKEVLSHLYEPFFTTKEKEKGTGLGLATVYGIVKQNGGIIETYSEVNKGTTFKIYFPKALQDTPAVQLKEHAGLPKGRETIMLVEDNAQVLEYTRDTLELLGYKVIIACSGEEALNIAVNYKGTIDLLMTDIILPGMNGRATADAIAAQIPALKILYNSGYTAEVIDKHGILEQGLNFIGKPFTTQALALKVREVLDK